MVEHVHPSGLVISQRSLPGPRDNPPNDNPDPVNPPPVTVNPPGDFSPISVGPTSSDGFGNDHISNLVGGWQQPVDVQAWSGWPDKWATPLWGAGGQSLLGPLGSRVDVVFACLDLNASILSTMPPYLVHGAQPDSERSASWLTNPEPQLYVSWAAFAKELFWCYRGVGEAFVYALARDATGFPSRFMLLNPSVVTVDRVAGAIEYTIAGEPVDPADILHIKYASWPGDLRGHGSLEVAGARLLTVAALTKYATGLAEAGGLPPAVIKYPRRVNRRQISQIQHDWLAARVSGMGLPAILADGVELQEIGGQLRDAALAELSKFSEARIANLLGVPPFLIGLPSADAGTYVNSTNVFDFHWRAYLRPEAFSVSKAISGWLLPRGWELELNRDEYVRPSLLERAQAYQLLIGSGVITPEEVRTIERYAGRGGAEATSGAPTVAPAPPAPAPAQPNGRPVMTNA